jgi:hypothetical protein
MTDPEYAKILTQRENERIGRSESATANLESRILRKSKTRIAKIQAQRAAAILTETLGVPHVVVESIDANGKKTFQPVRQEFGLPGKVDETNC